MSFLASLKASNPKLFAAILNDPTSQVLPIQLIEGEEADWKYTLVQAGRGFGKTFAGAAWLRAQVDLGHQNIALVGATHKDVANVMVPEFLRMFPPDQQPRYIENKDRIELPNGGICYCYSSDQGAIRGGNHTRMWWDELCKFCSAIPSKVFDYLSVSRLAVRGKDPAGNIIEGQIVFTSTPKRWKLFKELNARAETDLRYRIMRGSSFDNPVTKAQQKEWEELYGGTQLGQQELYGELISNDGGSLWTEDMLASCKADRPESFLKIVVAVDPAVSTGENSDETGIIVAGLATEIDPVTGVKVLRSYVLEDRSGKYSPNTWGRLVSDLCQKWSTRLVVVEKNMGGNLVKNNLLSVDQSLLVQEIHAKTDKLTRAQPVFGLYEQGKVKHVHGTSRSLELLEYQLTTYDGTGKSPDRLDALVYAITYLMVKPVVVPAYRNSINAPW